jgi:hypothetical protein
VTTQVVNSSNGYVATVFHRSDDEFTTDYIHLKDGENHLKIEFQNGNKKEERTVVVKRLPAQAQIKK